MTSLLSDNDNSTTKLPESTKLEEKKSYFLAHNNFQRLQHLQREIFQTYDISPSLRKLVNLLITDENIEKLRHYFREHYDIHDQ